jgi:anti-anti-sigma regulatory factor
MLKIDIKNDGSTGEVNLEGDITIQSAGEFREAMISALGRFEKVCVNVDGVLSVDVSCFQILCSAHRTAVRSNKSLICSGSLPAGFKKTAQDAGYIRDSGCAFDSSNSCIWAANDDVVNNPGRYKG